MKYKRIIKGNFQERPNRFLAYVELNGEKETVHVKNTGRCEELLRPGAAVYVQESENPQRKTKWDLIAVEKENRVINMDSQAPNKIVQEWVEAGGLCENVRLVKPETTYGNSRFDLYIETDEKKIFVEVKGVTLEEQGVVKFPDAPSERAVKHLEELRKAVKEGYEAYVIFVIQMRGVRYFTPNIEAQPEFDRALKQAKAAGVKILAYDCDVAADSISIAKQVPVVLEQPLLQELAEPLTAWYRENKRDLPWRHDVTAYKVWVSEIMLQQTRVEAVKPYYERFLNAFPTIEKLAEASEDLLLKMWEGLGYYNRVRNMQKAAQQIMENYAGKFPEQYEQILELKGIGNYTAGAISSFAFGIPKPAVDGNVLRVVSRVLASDEDIMKASVRTKIEKALEEVIPKEAASDFNQGLIELGAIVCVPNGEPKCTICPLQDICRAKALGIQMELPVKTKAKARRIEKRTVCIFKDGQSVALNKRPNQGLLAGLYEFPNLEGHLTKKEIIEYGKAIGLTPVRIKKLEKAKHIFSHVEWHMTAYEILVDELEKDCTENFIFANKDEIEKKYSIPSAFVVYLRGVKGE